MFEHITYEGLLKRMMDRVLEEQPGIDTREGSVIYNALAPAAVELQNMYIQLDWILDQSFADTQDREYLIKRCAERGIIPYAASCAVMKGEFNLDISLGDRFSQDGVNYTAVEKIGDGMYKMVCEIPGMEGNEHLGDLIPVRYIPGLEWARLTELLIPGEDEEGTEELRKRYFNSLNSQAFGGNVTDYLEKTNAIPGVGAVKVIPAWNGGGTVKLILLDSEFHTPSEELLGQVQEQIDPLEHSGKGYGTAPIGHQVTVTGANAFPVNLKMDITYQEGWTWEDVKETVGKAVDDYLLSLAREWAQEDQLIVRASRIEMAVLNLAGVIDVTGITLNGTAGNLTVEGNAVPVRGEILG